MEPAFEDHMLLQTTFIISLMWSLHTGLHYICRWQNKYDCKNEVFLVRIENIVRVSVRGNSGYQLCLRLLQCFQKASYTGLLKLWFSGKELEWYTGSVLSNHFQEPCLSFHPRFLKFEKKKNITTFDWLKVWYTLSEVVLISNVSKWRKFRKQERTWLRMVSGYGPWRTMKKMWVHWDNVGW